MNICKKRKPSLLWEEMYFLFTVTLWLRNVICHSRQQQYAEGFFKLYFALSF